MKDFILRENISLELCDELLDYYKNLDQRFVTPGHSYIDAQLVVDPEIKDSLDTNLKTNRNLWLKYIKVIESVIRKYCEEYSVRVSGFSVDDDISVQYYKPGGGYKAWHCERGHIITSQRLFAFMTYLNDVDDAGETEFLYQNVKIQPKKGLTLMWPAEWTHTHRGIPSPTQDKYIVTGWISFV